MTTSALSWTELEALANYEVDTVNGLTNAQSRLRKVASEKQRRPST